MPNASNNQIVFLIASICIIAWVTMLLPTIVYLITDWSSRRDQLFSVLDDDALALYYQKFFPADECKEPVRERFEKDFYQRYGIRHYLIPLFFLALISGLGMWGTEETVRSWLTGTSSFKLPAVAISAFLGAYAWVLLDQFSRYQSRNFTKHNIYNGVYRFLITIPLGFSLAAFVKDNFGVPVAFLLATFPTQTLLKFGRRLVVDQLGFGGQKQDSEDGPNELTLLQGIDRENAERFQSVGLTTIVELAWFDPIELTIRTNLEFNYVIDCISQALVWVYFTKDTPKLYSLSLRGAQEARYLWITLDSHDPNAKEAATEILKKAAEILGTNEKGLRHTLDAIADDPYSEFLAGIWGGGTSQRDQPKEPVVPSLAARTIPSPFPLQFTEVTAFRGDFGGTEVVNPKGIAYHSELNKLIVSLSPFTSGHRKRVQILNTVEANGARARFAATYKTFRDVESLIAVVPQEGPPVDGKFIAGEVFVGRGTKGQISRLAKDGSVISDVFADLQTGTGIWGGLAFDTGGDFDGRLVAATTDGKIFLVGSNGTVKSLTDLAQRLEGVAIAPNDFGPYKNQLIVGVEGSSDTDPESGKVYAIDSSGNKAEVADIGFAAEEIQFVPANGGTYYQAELCFDRERENRILAVSSSQFLGRHGRMLVVNELGGELHEVAWSGTRYTQSVIGRAPGRWTSHGFAVQGTELEAGCFAVRPPTVPTWKAWSAIPGGGTTDCSVAVATDASNNLLVLAKGISDRRVYLNSRLKTTQAWIGWSEVSPGGLTTDHALAMAMHNKVVYAFAVRSDGAIVFKRLIEGTNSTTNDPWIEVPGGGRTDAAVAATEANGRLVLSAKGIGDQQIYLNELAPGGRSWSGWYCVPGNRRTALSPTVVSFQDELYILIKGLTSQRILTKVRSADGRWTDWAEIPGKGQTDAPLAAVAARNQLFVFAKGVNDRAPYWNIASETGTWSLWQAISQGGTTDTSLAVTAISNQLFLFQKGIDDRQIYMRHTTK